MTATEVDGKKVIATEPVLTPLSTPEFPIYYKQTVRLLLDDNTETYACNHSDCTFSSVRIGSVRSHLVVHNGPRKKPSGRTAKVTDDPIGNLAIDLRDLTLDDILSLADQQLQQDTTVLDKLREDRDTWKERAKAAEATLKKVKTAWLALNGNDPV